MLPKTQTAELYHGSIICARCILLKNDEKIEQDIQKQPKTATFGGKWKVCENKKTLLSHSAHR